MNNDTVPEADRIERVVLITGATSGIGRVTSLAFAAPGVSLVIAGRDRRRGQDVVDACRAGGAEAMFVVTNVMVRGDVDALFTTVRERFGRLDVAFNNAGYQEPRASLARAVVWLASDASSFVVGHNLCVDGGFLTA